MMSSDDGKAFVSMRYRVIQPIGKGSCGACYLAEDTREDRLVVIKQIHILSNQLEAADSRVPNDPISYPKLRSAMNEIQLLQAVSHPNIIQYLDSFVERKAHTTITASVLMPNNTSMQPPSRIPSNAGLLVEQPHSSSSPPGTPTTHTQSIVLPPMLLLPPSAPNGPSSSYLGTPPPPPPPPPGSSAVGAGGGGFQSERSSYAGSVASNSSTKATTWIEHSVSIVTEFAEFGDLAQEIQRRRLCIGSPSLEQQPQPSFDSNSLVINAAAFDVPDGYFTGIDVWLVLIQLMLALRYCHSRRILHRDIKTKNVFVMQNGVVKLGDFGIARQLTDEMAKTLVGSPYFMAPEIHQNLPYGEKSDVWSLGCVLFQLCTLRHAFTGDNLQSIFKQICAYDTDKATWAAKWRTMFHLSEPTVPESPPVSSEQDCDDMWMLCQMMLAYDPQSRPSVSQLLSHELCVRGLKRLMARYPECHYPELGRIHSYWATKIARRLPKESKVSMLTQKPNDKKRVSSSTPPSTTETVNAAVSSAAVSSAAVSSLSENGGNQTLSPLRSPRSQFARMLKMQNEEILMDNEPKTPAYRVADIDADQKTVEIMTERGCQEIVAETETALDHVVTKRKTTVITTQVIRTTRRRSVPEETPLPSLPSSPNSETRKRLTAPASPRKRRENTATTPKSRHLVTPRAAAALLSDKETTTTTSSPRIGTASRLVPNTMARLGSRQDLSPGGGGGAIIMSDTSFSQACRKPLQLKNDKLHTQTQTDINSWIPDDAIISTRHSTLTGEECADEHLALRRLHYWLMSLSCTLKEFHKSINQGGNNLTPSPTAPTSASSPMIAGSASPMVAGSASSPMVASPVVTSPSFTSGVVSPNSACSPNSQIGFSSLSSPPPLASGLVTRHSSRPIALGMSAASPQTTAGPRASSHLNKASTTSSPSTAAVAAAGPMSPLKPKIAPPNSPIESKKTKSIKSSDVTTNVETETPPTTTKTSRYFNNESPAEATRAVNLKSRQRRLASEGLLNTEILNAAVNAVEKNTTHSSDADDDDDSKSHRTRPKDLKLPLKLPAENYRMGGSDYPEPPLTTSGSSTMGTTGRSSLLLNSLLNNSSTTLSSARLKRLVTERRMSYNGVGNQQGQKSSSNGDGDGGDDLMFVGDVVSSEDAMSYNNIGGQLSSSSTMVLGTSPENNHTNTTTGRLRTFSHGRLAQKRGSTTGTTIAGLEETAITAGGAVAPSSSSRVQQLRRGSKEGPLVSQPTDRSSLLSSSRGSSSRRETWTWLDFKNCASSHPTSLLGGSVVMFDLDETRQPSPSSMQQDGTSSSEKYKGFVEGRLGLMMPGGDGGNRDTPLRDNVSPLIGGEKNDDVKNVDEEVSWMAASSPFLPLGTGGGNNSPTNDEAVILFNEQLGAECSSVGRKQQQQQQQQQSARGKKSKSQRPKEIITTPRPIVILRGVRRSASLILRDVAAAEAAEPRNSTYSTTPPPPSLPSCNSTSLSVRNDEMKLPETSSSFNNRRLLRQQADDKQQPFSETSLASVQLRGHKRVKSEAMTYTGRLFPMQDNEFTHSHFRVMSATHSEVMTEHSLGISKADDTHKSTRKKSPIDDTINKSHLFSALLPSPCLPTLSTPTLSPLPTLSEVDHPPPTRQQLHDAPSPPASYFDALQTTRSASKMRNSLGGEKQHRSIRNPTPELAGRGLYGGKRKPPPIKGTIRPSQIDSHTTTAAAVTKSICNVRTALPTRTSYQHTPGKMATSSSVDCNTTSTLAPPAPAPAVTRMSYQRVSSQSMKVAARKNSQTSSLGGSKRHMIGRARIPSPYRPQLTRQQQRLTEESDEVQMNNTEVPTGGIKRLSTGATTTTINSSSTALLCNVPKTAVSATTLKKRTSGTPAPTTSGGGTVVEEIKRSSMLMFSRNNSSATMTTTTRDGVVPPLYHRTSTNVNDRNSPPTIVSAIVSKNIRATTTTLSRQTTSSSTTHTTGATAAPVPQQHVPQMIRTTATKNIEQRPTERNRNQQVDRQLNKAALGHQRRHSSNYPSALSSRVSVVDIK